MGSRTAAALAVLAVAAPIAGCGSNGKQHTPRTATIHDPGYVVSSEALAGHPTATPPKPHGCPRHPRERPIRSRQWLAGVEITEYFPTPESWFVGVRVHAPGLPGRHRVDWLYSSSGIAMEGSGVGLDGVKYAVGKTGDGGWVNAAGRLTVPNACASHWSRGRPVWFAGGWRNAQGGVTFPLERGGWSNGPGVRTVSYGGMTFAQRESKSIRPYYTVAVDPGLIPIGSKLYIPAYKPINGGWFVAGDTGGGIIGRHLDVYRPPTAIRDDGGRYLVDQRVYVIPPRG